MTRNTLLRRAALLAATALLAACKGDTTEAERPFILGAEGNGQIGLVVNSTGNSLTLFRLGDPREVREVPFGASSSVTPTGISLRGRTAAVPLGNAASVALVDLEGLRVTRFFIFPKGNATGSAFADDTTLLAANTQGDYVGRVTLGQASDSIRQTVGVAPDPTEIVMAGGRAAVVSSNLGSDFQPLGNGVVTFLDPRTLQVQGRVETGGTNPQHAAVGPDGLLYVVNTRDYVADGSVTVINAQAMRVEATIPGFGAGAGAIHIDAAGLAYVSSFGRGTVVWNTRDRTFVRGAADPLCAKLANGSCRGAFAATTDVQGNVYQAFFGDVRKGLAPNVFVYRAGNFALSDSIGGVNGPTDIEVRSF